MSLVDTAFVGRLGAAQLGAVGLSSIIFNFCGMIFNFLVVVTTPTVAAAVAQGDFERASRTTAQGLWVALICGTLAGVGIFQMAPYFLRRIGASPEITGHALAYLRCRAIACPALLSLFVATGSFRGFQDTKTPLISAVLSNVANFTMDIIFIFVFGWGVAGAALATSASQYVGMAAMLYLLNKKRVLNFADLRHMPSVSEIAPLLRSGLALSVRNLGTMGVILYATTLVSRMGAATLAAHEIMRQVFIFSIQLFSALDVTAQSLVGLHLGKKQNGVARAVLLRILQIALGLSFFLMGGLYLGRSFVPRVFTQDPAVIAIAERVFPILAAFIPFDAAAAAMDGGLLGASETSYASRATLCVAFAVWCLLQVLPRNLPGLAGIWLSLKGLSVGRTLAATYRLTSSKSPLSKQPHSATVSQASGAQQRQGPEARAAQPASSTSGLHVSEDSMHSEASSGIDTGADGGSLSSQQTAQSQQGQSLEQGNGHNDTLGQRTSTSTGQSQPG
ncbi:g3599 [Coccomyxa viridis]|uniref:Protein DETOXIFICATION n=1 Tax=Coccomyxa viridis TaxID=1274662 RepID=A0ABP1FTC3_9CHLO